MNYPQDLVNVGDLRILEAGVAVKSVAESLSV